MKLKKSPLLVLCALLAAVCGCGTEEPNASQDMTDVVFSPDADFTNSIGMSFNLIPASEFMMGSTNIVKDPHPGEGPVHQVRITKPYYLGVTEVTQGQWKEVMGTRPWKGESFTKSDPECAASHVNWDDAVEFCRKLSAKEGRTYRLPTEAEGEYACRAGSTTRYCFGDDDSDLRSYAWHDRNAWHVGERHAHQAGLLRANAWGLYDMHGNVFEWCQDRFDSDYYENSPVDNPTGPSTGSHREYRVCRGGCCTNNPSRCQSANRVCSPPDGIYNSSNGFRVALDPAE